MQEAAAGGRSSLSEGGGPVPHREVWVARGEEDAHVSVRGSEARLGPGSPCGCGCGAGRGRRQGSLVLRSQWDRRLLQLDEGRPGKTL